MRDDEPIPVPRSQVAQWKRALLYRSRGRYSRRDAQLRTPFALAKRVAMAVFFRTGLVESSGEGMRHLEKRRVPRRLFAPLYAVVRGAPALKGRVFLALACVVALFLSLAAVKDWNKQDQRSIGIDIFASGIVVALTLLVGTVAWPPIRSAAARRESRKQAQPLLHETVVSCSRLAARLADRYAAYIPIDFSSVQSGDLLEIRELAAIREGGDQWLTEPSGDVVALLDTIVWRSNVRRRHCSLMGLRPWRGDLLHHARACQTWTTFPTLELISIDGMMRLGEELEDPLLLELCTRIDNARLDLLERDDRLRRRAIRALKRDGSSATQDSFDQMINRQSGDDISRWGTELQKVAALAFELRRYLLRLSNYIDSDTRIMGLSRTMRY